MKIAFALAALTLAPLAAPALGFPVSARVDAPAARFEQAVASLPAGDPARYFVANSAVSFSALAVAGVLTWAAEMAARRRRTAAKLAEAENGDWRDEVMSALDYDLQAYSRRLRRAA